MAVEGKWIVLYSMTYPLQVGKPSVFVLSFPTDKLCQTTVTKQGSTTNDCSQDERSMQTMSYPASNKRKKSRCEMIKKVQKKKVVPGIELGLPESESDVLTITLYNQLWRQASTSTYMMTLSTASQPPAQFAFSFILSAPLFDPRLGLNDQNSALIQALRRKTEQYWSREIKLVAFSLYKNPRIMVLRGYHHL
jgi:hypothetical protein